MGKVQVKNYFPQLDGLRFLAFLMVFIHHAPLLINHPVWQALRRYGWMGVDLFLCLSAFLFTKLLYLEYQRTGTINIPFFYIRRTLRIWPLYYLFVIAMLIITFYTRVDVTCVRILGMLTFTDDLLTASLLNYNVIAFAGHLWTISYEEQFYAVIPWLLRYLFKASSHAKTLILAGALVVGLLIRAVFIYMQVPYVAIWVLPFTHFDSILFGLFIGLGILDPIMNRIPSLLTGLAGLLSLATVSFLSAPQVAPWIQTLTYFFLTGLGMALILHTVLRTGHLPAMRWISSRPMAFLGKISYGLYVYHLLCLSVVADFFHTDPASYWPWVATVFVLPLMATIIVSSVSYTFVEKPFLRLKERFAIVPSRPA